MSIYGHGPLADHACNKNCNQGRSCDCAGQDDGWVDFWHGLGFTVSVTLVAVIAVIVVVLA